MNEISNKWIGKNTIRPDGAEKVTDVLNIHQTLPCLA